MTFSASQIALIVNGKIEGNPEVIVTNFGKIEVAKVGELAFLSNPKYEDYLYSTQASVVLVNDDFILKQPVKSTLICVKDAYAAFAILLNKYEELRRNNLIGIEQPSFIDPTASLGNNCYVAAFAYISKNVKIGNNVKIHSGVVISNDVVIGDNVVLYAGSKIYHNCVLGNDVIIHANTIIGSDGFGFAPMSDGTFKKIPQLGNVIIEDDVEIGSNTTIDRATLGSTIIKKGAKLDNLIQIGHNVEVGNNTVIAAQTGVSGSTKIGNNVMCGGQVGFAGHIVVGNGVKIGAQSGINRNVEDKQSINGTPFQTYTASLKSLAIHKNLPHLEKRILQLEKIIEDLMIRTEKPI
jgi:UDP-3-O-[3-hydroxymyristoyl] glucosamine N-acyltransferase